MLIWLVASGLTLIFGVLGILNFAHGSAPLTLGGLRLSIARESQYYCSRAIRAGRC